MPCKHADKMMIYAKQAAEMDEPWKLWRLRESDNTAWFYPYDHIVFRDDWQYQQIPKTIQIGIHQVPEPMREKPELGTEYWIIDIMDEDGVCLVSWNGDKSDHILFNYGMCHATKEAAIAHAKALFSFSEIKD